MVADRRSDVAFVILLAGPGLSGGQIVVQQLADLMKAQGQPQAVIDQAVAHKSRSSRRWRPARAGMP